MEFYVPAFEVPLWGVIVAASVVGVPLYLAIAVLSAKVVKWALTKFTSPDPSDTACAALIGMFWPVAVPLFLIVMVLGLTYQFIHKHLVG